MEGRLCGFGFIGKGAQSGKIFFGVVEVVEVVGFSSLKGIFGRGYTYPPNWAPFEHKTPMPRTEAIKSRI